MVSLYSLPDPTLLNKSYGTLRSCISGGVDSLIVIDVKKIHAVVAMVPHKPFGENSVPRYFVVEKPGLQIAELGGQREEVPEDE